MGESMRVMSFIGATVLVLLLAAGCGGSDAADDGDDGGGGDAGATGTSVSTPVSTATAGEGGGVDVCGLLTVAELEAATELTWDEGTFNDAMSSNAQAVCDWVAISQFATAQVMVLSSDESFEANRASAESVFGLGEAPSIPGADEVYATDEGSLIAMRIGGRFVQVAYIPPGPGNVLEATLELAKAVASRI